MPRPGRPAAPGARPQAMPAWCNHGCAAPPCPVTTPTPDDDPTRALDGFAQRLRARAAPDAPPDLADLSARLRAAGGTEPGPATEAGGPAAANPPAMPSRRKQRWAMDDVEDVPVLDLPRPPAAAPAEPPPVRLPPVDLQAEALQAQALPTIQVPETNPPPPPDAQALQDTTRAAGAGVAAGWAEAERSATQPVWQPDAQALQLRPAPHPRLLTRWQAQAWRGAARRVSSARTALRNTPAGPVVEQHPAQHLVLLWPPQADGPPPGRWPQRVLLVPEDVSPAAMTPAQAALALLPPDALLWLDPASDVNDWALGAEIALHHLAGLPAETVEALRAFIAQEREAVFRQLNDGYSLALGAVHRR